MKKFKVLVAVVLTGAVVTTPFAYAYRAAAAMLANPVSVTAPTHDTDYQSMIDEAEATIAEYQAKANEAQAKIDSLNTEYDTLIAYIQELDEKQNEIAGQVADINAKIAELTAEKEATEVKLAEATEVMNEQYENMSERIKYVYENGETSYMDILFSSGNISDVLNRVEYVSQIAHYDDQLFANYTAAVIEVKEYQDEVNIQLETIAGVQEAYDAYQAYAEELAAAKQTALEEVSANLGTTEDLLSGYLSEIESGQYTIEQAEAAMQKEAADAAAAAAAAAAAKANANASSSSGSSSMGASYTGGGSSLSGEITSLVWPCPGGKGISSYFGPRVSPTAGASSYHKGIDIYGDYGTAIIAAASGTVEAAAYSSSMGNYVMISHGGSDYTVYMHCSSLAVTSGQYVSAGEVIAYMGSTGISTGNHLHFGVIDDGAYVNPLNYF